VNLYVPSSWKAREREQFIDSLWSTLPRAEDWVFIRDEPEEIDNDYPMGKWIRYEHFARPDRFDTTGFFKAITDAVNNFLKLETKLSDLFERAKRLNAATPSRRTLGRIRPERKP
jgi:hypothetical protein